MERKEIGNVDKEWGYLMKGRNGNKWWNKEIKCSKRKGEDIIKEKNKKKKEKI